MRSINFSEITGVNDRRIVLRESSSTVCSSALRFPWSLRIVTARTSPRDSQPTALDLPMVGSSSGRPVQGHRRLILPRSRHLPVASTEGSYRNLNEIRVRLWT